MYSVQRLLACVSNGQVQGMRLTVNIFCLWYALFDYRLDNSVYTRRISCPVIPLSSHLFDLDPLLFLYVHELLSKGLSSCAFSYHKTKKFLTYLYCVASSLRWTNRTQIEISSNVSQSVALSAKMHRKGCDYSPTSELRIWSAHISISSFCCNTRRARGDQKTLAFLHGLYHATLDRVFAQRPD